MLIALIVVLLLVAVVLIIAAMRPDQFRIERSASIKATPERIFPFINDFHRWQSWSPYEKKDPAMQRTFEGPSSGPGAAYGWNGNKNIGSGRMEISESTPSSFVRIKLEFFTPFQASNTAEFVLEPQEAVPNAPEQRLEVLFLFARVVDEFLAVDKDEGDVGP